MAPGVAEHRLAVLDRAIAVMQKEIDLRERLSDLNAEGDSNLDKAKREEKEALQIQLLRMYPKVDSESAWCNNMRICDRYRMLSLRRTDQRFLKLMAQRDRREEELRKRVRAARQTEGSVRNSVVIGAGSSSRSDKETFMISRKDAVAEKVLQPPKAEVKLFVEEFVAAANLEAIVGCRVWDISLRSSLRHWMQSLGP